MSSICRFFVGLTAFFLLCLLSSCTTHRTSDGGQDVTLRHASLLEMAEADSFILVRVKNPWRTNETLATYVLVPRAYDRLPQQLPEGTVVRTPLQRTVVTSSVHASLALELRCLPQLVGMTDVDYVVDPQLRACIGKGHGQLRPLGSSMQPDIEMFRAVGADAVFVSPFENAGHGAIDRLGIPVIECADYMETSPLGRAEWVRFFGRLWGKAEQADSLFQVVERDYTALAEQVGRLRDVRPTVMCDLPMGGTWYEPGGGSTMGIMLRDAGARYLWADRDEAGSLMLNFESVFARGREAQIWLVKYGAPADATYSSIQRDNAHFTEFNAWKTRKMWGCNTTQVPFYEATPFHPERLLRNLVGIFHPGCLESPDTTYYRPLR